MKAVKKFPPHYYALRSNAFTTRCVGCTKFILAFCHFLWIRPVNPPIY